MLLLLAALVAAEPADNTPDWSFRHQLAASYFPEGLRYAFRAQYEIPLWNSGSVLFEDTFIAPGVYVDATPAYFHVGPRVHWAPIAVFELEAQFEYGYYFGTFSGVTDLYSPGDAADSDTMDALDAAGHKTSGSVFRGLIAPTLQGRVGKFILALPQEFYFFQKTRPAGKECTGDSSDFTDADAVHDCVGDYWYESQLDATMAWKDVSMTNSAVAFWSFRDPAEEDKRRFWLGLRFDHQYIFGTADRTTRLGPIAVFRPTDQRAMPTFAVFTQIYLESRLHPLVPPYIAVAAIW